MQNGWGNEGCEDDLSIKNPSYRVICTLNSLAIGKRNQTVCILIHPCIVRFAERAGA